MRYLDKYTNEEISRLLNTLNTNKVAEIMKFDKSESNYIPRKRVINMMMNNFIKSDCFEVEHDDYHGLRACINLNEQITEDRAIELFEKIAKLEIAPSRVFVDFDVVHLFFQPINKIYFKDFIEDNKVFAEMFFLGWSLDNSEFLAVEANDEEKAIFSLKNFDAEVTIISGLVEGTIYKKKNILKGDK